MAETPSLPQLVGARADHVFPKLTGAQIARIAAHGARRAVAPGEVLVDAGDQVVPFLVVTAGAIEVVRIAGGTETLVAVHGPGQFSGEINMISGRRALFRVRGREVLRGDLVVADEVRPPQSDDRHEADQAPDDQ